MNPCCFNTLTPTLTPDVERNGCQNRKCDEHEKNHVDLDPAARFDPVDRDIQEDESDEILEGVDDDQRLSSNVLISFDHIGDSDVGSIYSAEGDCIHMVSVVQFR